MNAGEFFSFLEILLHRLVKSLEFLGRDGMRRSAATLECFTVGSGWQHVLCSEEGLLRRCLQIALLANPREGWYSEDERSGHLVYDIHRGKVELFYLANDGYELVARFEYRASRRRYLVCFGVDGQVAPQLAVDQLLTICQQYAQKKGVDELYGLEPRRIGSAVLSEIYGIPICCQCFTKELVADLGDRSLVRLRMKPNVLSMDDGIATEVSML